MAAFEYQNGRLHCERVPIEALAESTGTPVFVYSRARLVENYRALDGAFGAAGRMLCYAVKANSNPSIIRLFAGFGGGADVVSGGELALARRCGVPAERIIFSGAGKTDAEIALAVTEGVCALNAESVEEIGVIGRIAGETGKRARVSVRVNPHINPNTHPYIATGMRDTKFGIPAPEAEAACRLAASLPSLRLVGVHCHIGSMVLECEAFQEAARELAALAGGLIGTGIGLEFVDIGGGLGIDYARLVDTGGRAAPASAPSAAVLFDRLLPILSPLGLRVVFEPGRALVADACALVARVQYVKSGPTKRFAILDAGMNDLIRPSLYNAFHQIVPARLRPGAPVSEINVVGPVCESGDFFAHDRPMPELSRGDLVAVTGAGAYGYSLSSNYNGRPRPAEVLVDGDAFKTIRRREPVDALWRGTEIE
jgi:diaminopimelate decarboxylase